MVSILKNKKLLPGTMTDHVHQLISLISCKNITVVSGKSAYITPDQVIHLPPLPPKATERDFIKYLCLGTHEQAHIFGKSDFTKISKNRIIKSFQNVLEDIRCEQLQEIEYPGLKHYRVQFLINVLEDFLNEELQNASLDNVHPFIDALGKYIIGRIRFIQLDASLSVMHPSKNLLDAYQKYISDLEPRILSMASFDDSDVLAHLIYDRIKELLKNDLKQKQKERDKKNVRPDNSESSGDMGSSDSEEQSEEETNSDPEDNRNDKPAEENDSDTDDNNQKPKEKELLDDESSTGNEEEQEEDRPEISDSDNTSGDAGEDPESGSNDEDSEDQDSDGTPEESEPQSSDNNSGSDTHDDDSESDSDSESGKEVNDKDCSDGQNESDLGERECSDSDASGAPESDPQEPEEDTDQELDRDVEQILEEVTSQIDDIDIMSEIKREINQIAETNSPYMVDPRVKDIIDFGRETSDSNALEIRDRGLKILGPKASQLTNLFIQQTKPRTLHNRLSGRLDVISFANDIQDTREDIFSNSQGAKLDKAAVSFLIDNSGSMENSIADMYSILSGILLHLSKALIPTEAIGYTVTDGCPSEKWRSVPAYLTIIKDFKEAYGNKILRRCVRPPYMGETNDLDGMRFVIPRLWARPEKKKVIMVLCDGEPSMGNMTGILTEAYKEYIKICREAGIIIFGIGLDVDLRKFFGDDCVSVSTTNAGDVLVSKLTQILNRGRV